MEGTYEYELERAELLGVEPISKELWEEQAKARREVEMEQELTEYAHELEANEEKMAETHGKMEELNNILSSTQLKINKFKTVCGSFTSLLKIRSGSPAPPDRAASNAPPPSNEPSTSSINNALDNLDEMKETQQQTNLQYAKKQALDINQKVRKSLGGLDRLLAKTEQAEVALQNQNQTLDELLRQ